jgi:hypothetical protein
MNRVAITEALEEAAPWSGARVDSHVLGRDRRGVEDARKEEKARPWIDRKPPIWD